MSTGTHHAVGRLQAFLKQLGDNFDDPVMQVWKTFDLHHLRRKHLLVDELHAPETGLLQPADLSLHQQLERDLGNEQRGPGTLKHERVPDIDTRLSLRRFQAEARVSQGKQVLFQDSFYKEATAAVSLMPVCCLKWGNLE